MLEPTSSAWMYAPAGRGTDPLMMRIGSAFQEFVNRLERLQVEYDLGCENIISNISRVENARLFVGQRGYDLVVLPPGTQNLNGPTVKILGQYLHNGGKLLSFVDAPGRVDGAHSGAVAQLARQYASQWVAAASLESEPAGQLLRTGDYSGIEGKLFHQRRQLRDGQLLFFANASLEQPARASGKIEGRQLLRLDPLHGKTYAFPASSSGKRLSYSLELPPGGSLLLLSAGKTA
ncbi:MAG: GldG family protein, partial [Acidobacteria bacterium]|nr:GldG family protein [Acidobacteriota bacterium]